MWLSNLHQQNKTVLGLFTFDQIMKNMKLQKMFDTKSYIKIWAENIGP